MKPEYRKNAVWMMNDTTALALRKLKDADSGKKPILFGDLSYYWIIDRSPVSMKVLQELFAAKNQVGYLCNEYLDARLIRSEAVKVIAIK